jgi:hypothetical protein
MMTLRLSKIVVIGIALLVIQACSHPIEIEGQGDVTSDGDRHCYLEESTLSPQPPSCGTNYVIGAYDVTYYPLPRTGWKFDHWVTYCTDATPPNYECSFDIPAQAVRDFWGKTVPPLKAVFIIDSGLPVTDTVTVDGREWAQPDLFVDLSWNQIEVQCPSGICSSSAVLNGYSMSGWTLASVDDVNALFNHYIGYDALGPGPDFVYASSWDGWGKLMFDDGFRSTLQEGSDGRVIEGLTANEVSVEPDHVHVGVVVDSGSSSGGPDSARTYGSHGKDEDYYSTGAWFYKVLSLSGSTNADGSMTWECTPGQPGEAYVSDEPSAIPEHSLPVCRG